MKQMKRVFQSIQTKRPCLNAKKNAKKARNVHCTVRRIAMKSDQDLQLLQELNTNCQRTGDKKNPTEEAICHQKKCR